MKINWGKLNKYLKGNDTIWGLYEGFHYVSNGHFMLKTRDLDKKTQAILLNTFGMFPQDRKEFMILRADSVTQLGATFKDVIDELEPEKNLKDTGLRVEEVVKSKNHDVAIFTDDKEYYYFDKQYLEILDMKDSSVKCNNPVSPMLITDSSDNKIIILPIRTQDDNRFLKDLSMYE